MPCLRAQAEVARGPGRELIVRHQCAVVVARNGRARAQAHLVGQLRAAQRLACTLRAGALVRRLGPRSHIRCCKSKQTCSRLKGRCTGHAQAVCNTAIQACKPAEYNSEALRQKAGQCKGGRGCTDSVGRRQRGLSGHSALGHLARAQEPEARAVGRGQPQRLAVLHRKTRCRSEASI